MLKASIYEFYSNLKSNISFETFKYFRNMLISAIWMNWNSHPEGFLRKGVLKICSKFTGKQPCWSMISLKLLCNFTEITLWYGCSPVSLLYIFRTTFYKNTSAGLEWRYLSAWQCDSIFPYMEWIVE